METDKKIVEKLLKRVENLKIMNWALVAVLVILFLAMVFNSDVANADAVPYADTPKIYTSSGEYMGRLSDNTNAYDSISNPNSIYGSKSSAGNIHDPYGDYGANGNESVLIFSD